MAVCSGETALRITDCFFPHNWPFSPTCRRLVGLEACAGAHYWARELVKLGHDARLVSPQFVKPYVKGNKNDANDAEAVCETVGRPNMRFVPVKSIEQQDIQMLHWVRSGLVKERTAFANRARGLLGEYGLVVGLGLAQLNKRLPELLEDAENGLTVAARHILSDLYVRLAELDKQVATDGDKIQAPHQSSLASQAPATVPGIGPITATALLASLGDGKAKLLSISKRGDVSLRTLLIHGTRAVVKTAAKKDDAQGRWINDLVKRRNANIAAVALANKNARLVWALLTREETYHAPTLAGV